MKYQYTVVQPDASFYMITDAEQVELVLIKSYVKHNKKTGQLCLNDDVIVNQDEQELGALKRAMSRLLEGLLPERAALRKRSSGSTTVVNWHTCCRAVGDLTSLVSWRYLSLRAVDLFQYSLCARGFGLASVYESLWGPTTKL